MKILNKVLFKLFPFLLITALMFGCTPAEEDDEADSTTPPAASGTTPPAVVSVVPANSASDVAVNTGIKVLFSEEMDALTVTVNTSDSTCTGSIQVSSDSFGTCVQMSSSPTTTSNLSFAVAPSSNLANSTVYKIKITTGVEDSSGNAMTSAYQTSTGFTTVDATTTGDTTLPTVASVVPADSSSDIAVDTDVSVTFSEAMDASTVTVNTADSKCSGSIQVSSDSFSTCVQMSSSPTTTSNSSFAVTPNSNLANSTIYKIKITTGVKDSAGNALASAYQTSTGFTTVDATTTTSGAGTWDAGTWDSSTWGD